MPIRKAKVSDARGIAEVHIASWRGAYRGLLPDSLLDNLSVTRSQGMWQKSLAEGLEQALVFEQGGRIVGFASFGASRDEDAEGDWVGELYAIYLQPAVWRRGYGSALLDAAVAALEADGFTVVTLWVLRENARGRGFYEAAGFAADGGEKMETRGDGVELHEVRYRKVLERGGW